MSLGIAGVIEAFITPPGLLVLLLLAGLIIGGSYRRSGRAIILFSALMLYVCSMPITSQWLASLWETPTGINAADFIQPRARAIVILGAGRREHAPEFNLPDGRGDTVSGTALERLRYGAWLARKTQLPILVTGGLQDDDAPAEAVMMQQVLTEEFGVDVVWVEPDSRTTYENARFSRQLLAPENIDSVYLVTHALHMPRSVWSFEQAGFQVIPAPTGFYAEEENEIELEQFLPDSRAVLRLSYVLHEWIGLAWYQLRY